MTLNEFSQLERNAKVDILYQQGVYIGKRCENEKTVVLYQLEGFYVEVFYKKYRQRISRWRCSSSTDLLQPYLKQIDIAELLRCMT